MKTNTEQIFRIIDANANRVKEGLRVIEEYARFCLENKTVMQNIRDVRHSLDNLFNDIYKNMINARDIKNDHGKEFVDGKRDNIKNLLIANCKRVQEGLRVLEEYLKLVDIKIGLDFKSIRFKMYEIEKEMFNTF